MKNNYTHIDHSTYGGEVTTWSFDGHSTLAEIANKIAKDMRFDNQCKRNRDSLQKYTKLGRKCL